MGDAEFRNGLSQTTKIHQPLMEIPKFILAKHLCVLIICNYQCLIFRVSLNTFLSYSLEKQIYQNSITVLSRLHSCELSKLYQSNVFPCYVFSSNLKQNLLYSLWKKLPSQGIFYIYYLTANRYPTITYSVVRFVI